MRIVLAHAYTWPRTRRGGERYLHDLGWYLTRRGHDVTIVAGTGRDDGPPVEVVDGARVERVWRRPGRLARRRPAAAQQALEARRVQRALRGRAADVVHALWPPAAIGARRAGHTTLYSLLGMPTSDTFEEAPGLVPLLREGVAAAHGCAALSTAAADAAAPLLGGDWVVLPPGVRMDRFVRRSRPRGRAPTFLFSASLSVPYKGLPDVLAAFAQVLRQRPDAQLILSGAGSAEWALDQLDDVIVERVRAALSIPGTGDLDTADGRYAEATVTVLPSRNEAFGLSVVESLAVGTPVVVCDHGGPAEIVGSAPVGVTVPFGDPTALAAGMLRAADLADRPGIADACVARAAEWDWDRRIGPAHEDVYAALAAGDRASAAPS